MRGIILLCVLLALAYVQSVPVDNVEQQPAQSSEVVEKVDETAKVEEAEEVGKHPHNHHDHDWDHHNHHNDDGDHHQHHDDHNNDHHHHDDHNNDHHHQDDHHNDHHHHDDHNDNHNPDLVNLCAGARADRWHLPFPKDTHKFIKCDLTTGKGTIFTCPSGLVFNAAIQVCDYA